MPDLMKGNKWHERKGAKDRKGNPIVRYPVWVEPKIDEIRCHVKVGMTYDCGHPYHDPNKVEFLSYAGKPLANMQRFAEKFYKVAVDLNISEFDCGFEANGNFNDSYRWVRSTNGLPADLKDAGYCFHLYDLPVHMPFSTYRERAVFRDKVCCYLRLQNLICGAPDATECYSEDQVERTFIYWRNQGCEGAMVKDPEAPYAYGKRTDAWLKMKPEDDADGVIIGIEEAICGTDQPDLGLKVGDRLGRAGSVIVRCEDGSLAQPHGIAHDLGRDMLLHPEKYLGQWCEFKFMERDRQGGYRHPTFFRLREAKAWVNRPCFA